MTTEPEIAPGAVETPAPPVPAFSSGVSESAPASSESVDYDKLAEKLAPRIETLVEKRFQSGKDKRFADVEKISKYLAAAGGDVAKAAREMQVDEILAQQTSGAGGGTPSRETPEQVQQKVAQEVGEYLTDAGISYTDPDYVALAKQDHTSPQHYLKAVHKFIARRARQANPGLGAAAGDGGGGTPANTNLDGLYAQLRAAQKSSHQAEVKRLTALIREKGGIA